MKFSEEAEGSDPEGSDDGVEVDLDDEPGSLLDFLNVWAEKGRLEFVSGDTCAFSRHRTRIA